jgi:hypothetical protein
MNTFKYFVCSCHCISALKTNLDVFLWCCMTTKEKQLVHMMAMDELTQLELSLF